MKKSIVKNKLSIVAQQEELIRTCEIFSDDLQEMLGYIITLGRALPELPADEKVPAHVVSGCLANVWLVGNHVNGRLFLTGDSDALLTKGLLALLIELFSDQPLEEIISADLFFMAELGLDRLISLQRRAGFTAMLRKIKTLASDFLRD